MDVPAAVVVGLQFGDEGKGKVTDYLAAQAHVVVRSQGGANAGHTVVIEGRRFSLHQVPSGIFQGADCIIANGVVVDAPLLVEELRRLEEMGVDTSRVWVSDRAHLVLPYHSLLDGIREASQGRRIGTTRRGIGPAYADKSARTGVRTCDLLHPDLLRRKVREVAEEKAPLLEPYGLVAPDPDQVTDALLEAAQVLAPRLTDTSRVVNEALDADRRVLFEGAQGTFLDVDLGTYPYVTSSHPVAGGVTVGAGVGPTRIRRVIGVMKAYTSRVGEGPLPGELTGPDAEDIRQRGQEFGTTTGRPRRVGWADLVLLAYSARVNALDAVVVNAVDVLAGRPTVPVVVAYRINGRLTTEVPALAEDLWRAEPVYEELPGWPPLPRLRSAADLPLDLRRYLERIERAVRAPVAAVAAGRDRSDVLELSSLAGW